MKQGPGLSLHTLRASSAFLFFITLPFDISFFGLCGYYLLRSFPIFYLSTSAFIALMND